METSAVSDETRQAEAPTLSRLDRFSSFRENVRVVNNTLAQWLSGESYAVDLRNILCTRDEPVYRADGVHLFAGGHEKAGVAMAGVVNERFGY